MLSPIQTIAHTSGNQAPRGTNAPLSTDAAASEDRTAALDEFAAFIAALMPASPAPLSAAVQTEAEAGTPRIADTKEAKLPGPDAAKATVEPADAGALERVTRSESTAPATGSVASDGLDLTSAAPTATHVPANSVESGGRDPEPSAPSALSLRSVDRSTAPSKASVADATVTPTATVQPHAGHPVLGTTENSAAGVAIQLLSEAAIDVRAAAQVPSLPGGAGDPTFHQVAQLGAVEGSVTVRALPPAPAMSTAAPASRDDSVAKPDTFADEHSALVASASVGPSDVFQPEQGVLAAAETAAEPKGRDRVDHTALATDTPDPSEPAGAARTFADTTIADLPPGSALTAGPGLGTLTSPQDGVPGKSLPVLPEVPAEIVRQNIQHIAEATRHLDRGTIEITLSPEELGHVRLTVKSHDITGATVVLQADRPETLDLMRRHVDLLAQDMREFGYRELTFAFQDRRASNREAPAFGPDTDDSAGGSSAPGKVPGGTMTAASRPSIQDGRLDIRI